MDNAERTISLKAKVLGENLQKSNAIFHKAIFMMMHTRASQSKRISVGQQQRGNNQKDTREPKEVI